VTKIEDEVVILIAEDDEDDYLLIRESLETVGIAHHIYWVKNGEELLDFLHGRNNQGDASQTPRPWLILLDLNMPKKDGREALREIKATPALRSIPIVALTTSGNPDDVVNTYELGVNSYIRKPLYFEGFVTIARMLKKYWVECCILPEGESEEPVVERKVPLKAVHSDPSK